MILYDITFYYIILYYIIFYYIILYYILLYCIIFLSYYIILTAFVLIERLLRQVDLGLLQFLSLHGRLGNAHSPNQTFKKK